MQSVRKNCMIKFLMVVLIIVLSGAVLAACDSAEAEPGNTDGAADATLRLQNYGREISFSGVPEKVLTLGPNCSELFVVLGLSDRVVGNTLNNHSRGPLPEYAEAYEKIPQLTYGSATRESVISSGADFIYGIDWEFGDAGLDIAELESCGMIVYMNSAATLDDIYREVEDLGKIFAVEDVAAAFISDQKSRIEAVETAVADREPVRVLIYDSGNDGVFTCSGANFETLLVEKAGGKNIFDDLSDRQWMTVSYEEVLQRQPDVMVIHDYDSPSVEEKIREIKHSALAELDCVKEERFVTIELESVLPGSRMAHSVERLAAAFYPDLD